MFAPIYMQENSNLKNKEINSYPGLFYMILLLWLNATLPVILTKFSDNYKTNIFSNQTLNIPKATLILRIPYGVNEWFSNTLITFSNSYYVLIMCVTAPNSNFWYLYVLSIFSAKLLLPIYDSILPSNLDCSIFL